MIARHPGIGRIERGDDFSLRIHGRGDQPMVLWLTNFYQEMQGLSGVDRRAAILRAVAPLLDAHRTPEDWEQARPRLRVAVRPAALLGGHGGEDRPVTWPLAPFLVGLIVVDHESAMSYVNADQLRGWGIGPADAWDVAVANLADDGLALQATDDPNAWWIAGPDSYESSWLAVPRALRMAAEQRLQGDALIVAPTRNSVALVDADDPSAVARILDWADTAYREGPRRLSPAAYRTTATGIEEWSPPEGHSCHDAARRACRLLAAAEYEDQRVHVQDLLDKTGEDLYVAGVGTAQRPDGSTFTFANWPEAATQTLLPQVDYVGVSETGADTILVAWHDLLAVAADIVTHEPDWGLPRWRTNAWPGPDLLARLREKEVVRP